MLNTSRAVAVVSCELPSLPSRVDQPMSLPLHKAGQVLASTHHCCGLVHSAVVARCSSQR
jgi:hypothetical protein